MYPNSACGFTVAIPFLWTLHLNNFTRYVLGAFLQLCFIWILFVLQTICKSILLFFLSNEHQGVKMVLYKRIWKIFKDVLSYNITFTISVNNLKKRWDCFWCWHLFKGKNNQIDFFKFLSTAHEFNKVKRYQNTMYTYPVWQSIFVLTFYLICIIYLRSGTNNGFFGQFFGSQNKYFHLCTMFVVELCH